MGNGRPDRRRFLRWGAAGAAAGLGGCQALGLFGGSSVPDADFAFEYDPTGGQNGGSVTVRHDGGDGVPSDRLWLESSAGHDARWHELGSTDVAASERVTAGDTARLNATVINWPADVAANERIKAIYRREGALSTLKEFVPAVTPTPVETPVSTPTATGTPTATRTPTRTTGSLPGDDFEGDEGLSSYTVATGGQSSDWGTGSSEAPDGGSRHAYVSEYGSGSGTWTSVVGEGTRWDRSYRFSVLVRCSDWPAGTPYNSAWVAMRGSTRGDGTDKIKLQTFDTGASGADRPFAFAGEGVVRSRVETDIAWEEDVWYWVRGEVSENPESDYATAVAKIWRDGGGEPEEYQAEADVTNGISRPLPFEMKADGRTGSRVTLDVTHVVWEPIDDS